MKGQLRNKRTVTSYDVARLAGVSQSAVSRVFSPDASVSDAMTRRVREAADQLGYRPNRLAQAMITGRSRIVALVVAHFENQFFSEAFERLALELQARNYHVLTFMAADVAGKTDQVIEELLDYRVEGLITASVGLSNELTRAINDADIPIVMFNRSQDHPDLSGVSSDNVTGGRAVADYLLQSGCRRIAHIAGWHGASTQRDREAGFLAGLAAAGHTLFAREVGDFHHDQAESATRRMFATATRPDAVFVANDHMAFAVMDVLRHDLGLRVPEDVSVIGYDDVPMARWKSYNLTTVRQPVRRMVSATVDLLLDRIAAPDAEAQRLVFEGQVVERGTVRRPD
ncbi:LacI family DNA-binding transcriptional regulator [Rhodobacteraceae bacterium N5(2021)]|uniref:LacI family DNA-binding transcriptional regulator n=1 Tax=Gymnodinialimonas phycosphaerae TaxID=2841589 RepID=A0A975YED3_9RHOB|nr:LacI family DNA-binding transcriptional regulator [Gymnodinialimonas phycosphaerae]MBY4893544.1 LacI family DNA-binding transcriptional regulator [Gymnodinialimonas phycosphaerae]